MKKDTIILYANQYTALQWLSYEDMGFLFHQIFRWMNDIKMDTETEWSQALFLAFNFMTLQISIDNEKYLQKKERVDKWKQRKQGKKEEGLICRSICSRSALIRCSMLHSLLYH